MTNAEDHELINACLDGRTEAFGQLVTKYQDRLFHSLICVTGSRQDALDVAQDAFVQAFQKLHTFRGDSAFYSWLFRIALNASVDMKRRKRKPHVSLDAERSRSGNEPSDTHPRAQPSHALETEETQRLVREALSQLAEEFRTCLVLKEMDGMSYEEIADVVGCPIGTVRSRIHRARSELREKLRLLMKRDQ